MSLIIEEFIVFERNFSLTLSQVSPPKGRYCSVTSRRMSFSASEKAAPLPFFVVTEILYVSFVFFVRVYIGKGREGEKRKKESVKKNRQNNSTKNGLGRPPFEEKKRKDEMEKREKREGGKIKD